jgi:pimeloyl-ACP methyl ester carboxylesterase
MSIRSILATVLAALAFSAERSAKNQHAGAKAYNVSDAALVKTLPGFKNSFATMNGIRRHICEVDSASSWPRRSRISASQVGPGSRTFRIEGSGHFIAEEKPAALLAYLLDFLN